MQRPGFHLLALVLANAISLSFLPRSIAQEPAGENGGALADAARRNPLVAATLEQPRETPQQIMSAVARLLDLGHRETAALVLQELLQLQLDDAQRAELVRKFGVARFLQLIRLDRSEQGGDDADFAGAGPFAQACLDAAASATQDAAAVESLIASLSSAEADERIGALADLKTTGSAGVSGLLSALAGADDRAVRGQLLEALATMRPAVDAPLLAALAGGEGQLRRDAVELAGHSRLRGALPWLAVLAAAPGDDAVARTARQALTHFGASTLPTPAEAEVLVRQQIDEALKGILPRAVARAGDQWYVWNDQSHQLETITRSEDEIPLLLAARTSGALSELGGSASLESQRLAIILAWEEAGLLEREPLAAINAAVEMMTPGDLSELLAQALAGDHFAAAARAARQLGKRQELSALLTPDGRPSPLTEALESGSGNVRLAALEAIMQINPQTSFPGSSRVVDALWSIALGSGDATAVVAAPNATLATTWAGQLSGLGLDASAAFTGRSALLEATTLGRSSRLTVVVLDDRIARPPMRETHYQLRVNSRTSGVPILVFCPSERLAELQRWAESDPLTLAAPYPQGDGVLRLLVERARALSESPLPPPEARREQAKQALNWIRDLADGQSPYPQLLRDAPLIDAALYKPELTEPAVQLLAEVGAASSQASLIDLANLPAFAIELRRAAVDALAANVDQFGVQLTREQLLEQYNRYNASELADPETQRLLGRILDVLEGKDGSSDADAGRARP